MDNFLHSVFLVSSFLLSNPQPSSLTSTFHCPLSKNSSTNWVGFLSILNHVQRIAAQKAKVSRGHTKRAFKLIFVKDKLTRWYNKAHQQLGLALRHTEGGPAQVVNEQALTYCHNICRTILGFPGLYLGENISILWCLAHSKYFPMIIYVASLTHRAGIGDDGLVVYDTEILRQALEICISLEEYGHERHNLRDWIEHFLN